MRKLDLDMDEVKRLYVEEKKTTEEIGLIMGCNGSIIRKRLQQQPYYKKYSKKPLLPGTILAHGNLEVIQQLSSVLCSDGSLRQNYSVRCLKCGTVSSVLLKELNKPNRGYCIGCKRGGKKNFRWTGYGDIRNSIFRSYKRDAERRNFIFDITIEEIWDLFLRQNQKCAMTGVDLFFDTDKSKAKAKSTASLDRIDSKKGYIKDNIQWIHQNIQFMKWDFKQDIFIDWCRIIYKYQNSNKISEHIGDLTIMQHGKSWKGFGNISSSVYRGYQNGAKIRKLEWGVTIEQMWNLFIKQKGICALSGIPLRFSSLVKNFSEKTASLDRINSNLGYMIDNLQWIHKDLNIMKMSLTDQELIYWATLVYNHNCVL